MKRKHLALILLSIIFSLLITNCIHITSAEDGLIAEIQITKIDYPINLTAFDPNYTRFGFRMHYSIIIHEYIGVFKADSCILYQKAETNLGENVSCYFGYACFPVVTHWGMEPGIRNETWDTSFFLSLGNLKELPIGNYSFWIEFHFGEIPIVKYHKAHVSVTEEQILTTYEPYNITETFTKPKRATFSGLFTTISSVASILVLRKLKQERVRKNRYYR